MYDKQHLHLSARFLKIQLPNVPKQFDVFVLAVCTCAVRNCLECRYRQQSSQLSENNTSTLANDNSSAPSGDQMTPIQALIAGAQAPVKTGFLTKESQVTTFFYVRKEYL